MEKNLRKSQSLKCVATDHALSWTEAGLRDRKKSVSQLVAEYQNTVTERKKAVENKPKQILRFAALPVTGTETEPETLVRENIKVADQSADHHLTRSKSMEYLPPQRTRSTSALRELFETQVAMKSPSFTKPKNINKPQNTSVIENTVIHHTSTADGPPVFIETDAINHINSDESAEPMKKKENNVTSKVEKVPRAERRKTFTGLDNERIVPQTDDKRKSIADFRESTGLYGREKIPVSVKAISALYLSKVAAAETTGNLLKPKQDCTSPTGQKVFKFQTVAQDRCTSCLKPVYSMEKITADKHVFHKTCFCCKHCRQKLSLRNYTTLYGEFYCVFHFQQLFKKNGNYDEGFGHEQHKKRWQRTNNIAKLL